MCHIHLRQGPPNPTREILINRWREWDLTFWQSWQDGHPRSTPGGNSAPKFWWQMGTTAVRQLAASLLVVKIIPMSNKYVIIWRMITSRETVAIHIMFNGFNNSQRRLLYKFNKDKNLDLMYQKNWLVPCSSSPQLLLPPETGFDNQHVTQFQRSWTVKEAPTPA